MAYSDNIQSSEYFNFNYPGVISNGNTFQGNFDWNASDGRWKGSLSLTENTDGTLTFWFFDSNWFANVWTETFTFAWDVSGGYFNTPGETIGRQTLTVQFGGNQGTYATQTNPNAIVNIAGNPVNDALAVISPINEDTVTIDGVTAYRARLAPIANSGGSTAGMGMNFVLVSHYENGKTRNGIFQDASNLGLFVLQGATPAPVYPVIQYITPDSSPINTAVTLVGTNFSSNYGCFFNGILAEALSVTSTTMVVIVPFGISGVVNVYLANANYTSNSVPFTVAGSGVLSSALSNELAVLFPAPPNIPPAPILVAISVNPASVQLTVGQNQQFIATGTWNDGTTRTLTSDDITWMSNNFDGVGTIDPASGYFVAQVAGSNVQVVATAIVNGSNGVSGPLFGVANVQIAAPVPIVLVGLEITPQNPTVQVGQNVQFGVTGIESNGTVGFPPVAWSVQEIQANGIINQYGQFTATDIRQQLTGSWWQGDSGSWLPPDNHGPINRDPDVTTTDGPINYGLYGSTLPAGISSTYFYAQFIGYLIAPVTGNYTIGVNSSDGANLFINGTPVFLNLVTDQDANTSGIYTQQGIVALQANQRVPITVEWQNTTDSGTLQLIWTIPSQAPGLIPAANLEGDQYGGAQLLVWATAQDGSGVTANTTVTVLAPPQPPEPTSQIVSIAITPKTVVIPAGQTIQFTVTATDQFDNVTRIFPVFSVQNFSGAGTIDQNGIFSAQIAGNNVVVTATTTDGLFTTTAQVIVIAGPCVRLVVTPPSALLEISQGQQFVATGYDQFGNSISLTGVVWSIIGGIGTTDQTGLFSATNAGTGKIVATFGTITGTASINVLVVVGGFIIQNTPQQPFARIHIANITEVPTIIDTRVRGGGLLASSSFDTSDSFWWDISSFDGQPFQNYGVYAAQVIMPIGPGITLSPDQSATAVQQILSKYAAPQFLGVISPSTTVSQLV